MMSDGETLDFTEDVKPFVEQAKAELEKLKAAFPQDEIEAWAEPFAAGLRLNVRWSPVYAIGLAVGAERLRLDPGVLSRDCAHLQDGLHRTMFAMRLLMDHKPAQLIGHLEILAQLVEMVRDGKLSPEKASAAIAARAADVAKLFREAEAKAHGFETPLPPLLGSEASHA